MAKSVHIKPNKAAIAKLPESPGVKADRDRRAEAVLRRAQQIAPVKSGNYRENLHVEHVVEGGVETARVTSGTTYDIYVEAEHGTLAAALDAGGDL